MHALQSEQRMVKFRVRVFDAPAAAVQHAAGSGEQQSDTKVFTNLFILENHETVIKYLPIKEFRNIPNKPRTMRRLRVDAI